MNFNAVKGCVELPALWLVWMIRFLILLICIFILINEVVVINQTMNCQDFFVSFFIGPEKLSARSVYFLIHSNRKNFCLFNNSQKSGGVLSCLNFCVSVIIWFFFPQVWTVSQQLRAFQFHAWIPKNSSSDVFSWETALSEPLFTTNKDWNQVALWLWKVLSGHIHFLCCSVFFFFLLNKRFSWPPASLYQNYSFC